jgi:hypothetical protein
MEAMNTVIPTSWVSKAYGKNSATTDSSPSVYTGRAITPKDWHDTLSSSPQSSMYQQTGLLDDDEEDKEYAEDDEDE